MRRSELLKRVAVSVLVVLIVISGAALGSVIYADDKGLDAVSAMDNSEFEPQASDQDPLEAGGAVQPQVAANASGTVLIDLAHNNNLDRSDLSPLIRGLTLANHSVRFLRDEGNLSDQLAEAQAYVVMTPGSGYDRSDVNTVEEFVDQGGRLLLVGEPNRIRVQGFLIVRRSDEITELAAAHGISFDTRYLYNLETNDGNYKHVIAQPPETFNDDTYGNTSLIDVEQTTIYTGTQVTARNGSPLLVATAGTQLSNGGPKGQHTVAVRRGGVIAIGDGSFIQSDRYTIADNEVFLSYLIEFLTASENR